MGGVCGPDNCRWPHHHIVAAEREKWNELPSLAKLESYWKNCNVGGHVGFVAKARI
jgi:hypothetical protein